MTVVIIGCALAALWLVAVVMFKVTKGLIHLVLLIAIVLIVMHFIRQP